VAVNRESAAAAVSFTFVPIAGPLRTGSSTVPANGTREWADVLTSVFGYDALASISGALHVASDRKLLVTSRTFNQGDSGTFGGYLGAVTSLTALPSGVTGLLPQLKKSSRFRTNVGLTNLESGSVTVAVRLLDGSGRLLGRELSLTVPPAGFIQATDVFAAAGAPDADLAYATVEVRTPGGRVAAFASVIDNATNDPTIVPLSLP
jgi:hypothetical protein